MICAERNHQRNSDMNKSLIELEELRRVLSYDPSTGIFRWKEPLNTHHKVGGVAGTAGPHDRGHIRIALYGKRYRAHRLAWFYSYGVWPSDQIDHKDLNGGNNRLDNLREATNGQNNANKRVYGSSGLKGASLHPRGKKRWHAQIRVNKKNISLGYYYTAEAAHAAYVAAATKAHGEFFRT